MRKIISRFQKDLGKLQATLQKESNDLLEKVKHLELIDSLDVKKRELEKLFQKKLKKLEPAYLQFVGELRKNAKKAGIDIDKIEKDIKGKANVASKSIKKTTSTQKKKVKAGTKKAKTKISSTIKTVKKKVDKAAQKKKSTAKATKTAKKTTKKTTKKTSES